MAIVPIGERVLLKPLEQMEKTSGGIYIPEAAKEKKKEGEVLAVGKDKNGNDLPLVKGDKVIYGGYSSEDVDVNGNKYILVDYKDIYAKYD